MKPQVGWGDSPTAAARPEGGTSQKATAGWLSMLSVFEPHWQVHGRARGPAGSACIVQKGVGLRACDIERLLMVLTCNFWL
jgi:hypothetical protein